MRIVVITSCTGEKVVQHDEALTISDFEQGTAHIRSREAKLGEYLRPAEALYSGQQHVRLMRGVEAFRSLAKNGSYLDLKVLSAGYGLVGAEALLAPYEATFQGMPARQLREWADTLEIPGAIRDALREPYDLALILLGDGYLSACKLEAEVALGGPTLLFCGSRMAAKLPELPHLHVVPLSNREAKRFSCGLVALKGELGARILAAIAGQPSTKFLGEMTKSHEEFLGGLEGLVSPSKPTSPRKSATPNPRVDHVIKIPESWYQKPHRRDFQYFIPEWDDLVDPDYDFLTDTHSGGSGDWSNQVYAHQLYPAPNYDGILVSKVVAEKGKRKKERINELGVHRYLRVPRQYPVMGDCGAFGYIQEKNPPYSTAEILDYYSRLDFDLGVSVDHLIVSATSDDAKHRYQLTNQNAEDFLNEHKAQGHAWTPIGAVQGWDPQSYAAAARDYVKMGYNYIALGGLVRTSTPEILRVLQAVKEVVPEELRIHLFGVARLNALPSLKSLGLTSADSASYLRQAWMRTTTSYVLPHESYAALRIPEAGKSFRAKRMNDHSDLTEENIMGLERNALAAVRAYASKCTSVETALSALLEYDQLVTANRVDMAPYYRRTLEDRPWEHCECRICQDAGVEVIIFRGNNRNRRRGFHNTYVFYRLLEKAVLSGESELAHFSQSELPLFAQGAAEL
jgi:hypothetical protein